MNCGTGIAELLVHYRDGSDGLDKEVSLALRRSFGMILSGLPDRDIPSGPAGSVADPEEVADKVARIIFTFSRAAAAGAYNANVVAGLQTRLIQFLQRGIPIEAQMVWSPKKHWQLASESAVDLAELVALQTLISIDSTVRQVYPAGMSFIIDFEDVEFQFMEGQSEEILNAQQVYMSGIKRLVSVLGLDELFTLSKMSEHAKDAEELKRWRQQMAENYRALEAYWYESEGCPVSSWETLGSFNEIRRLGWKGTIPLEMRRYYLDHLAKVVASDAEKVDMVLRNFAGILLHYQAGLLRGSGQLDPLKISFVRSADGAPEELLRGRVNLRFAPRKLCSRVSGAAPFATKGFVCGRGNKMRVSFRGWHELAGARPRFTEGWFTIAGPNGDASVRSDFLHED